MSIEARTRTETPRRPPGRPRRFEANAALDAALELFWHHGYRTTTTRDLENALGLSQSSIYNAFGSKQDLLQKALDRYETITDQELLQPLEKSKKGLAAIETFFVSLGHWVTHKGRRGCMLINMMAEDGAATQAITKRSRIYRSRVRTALKESIARAARMGETTNDQLDQRADLLVGMVLGLNIAARGGASQPELGRLLNAVRTQVRGWRV